MGVHLKDFLASHWEMDRLGVRLERVRPGWMMDGVKTEEGWLLGPLADGSAIISGERRGRRPGS